MDTSSVTSLIYQAVFITIFVIASSITINLFTTINNYSVNVDEVVKSDSISEVVSENEAKLNLVVGKDGKETYEDDFIHELAGYEVYSIVNNYGMGVYDENNVYRYTFGNKYNKAAYSRLAYLVTVIDKDNKYVNDISKINLTGVYTIEYKNNKKQKVYASRDKLNYDNDSFTVTNTEEEDFKELILTEKGGK